MEQLPAVLRAVFPEWQTMLEAASLYTCARCRKHTSLLCRVIN